MKQDLKMNCKTMLSKIFSCAALVLGLIAVPSPVAAHTPGHLSENRLANTSPGYIDGLIRDILHNGHILVIQNRNPGLNWHSTELEAVVEVLDHLPREYKSVKLLRLIKKHGKSGVSISRRVIYLPAASTPPDKAQFKSMLVRYLTRFYDHDHRISEGDDWRRISRWTGWDILGNKPENINPEGFALPEGRKSPAEDFATSVQLFFFSPQYTDPARYLKYRLPSKYRFIQNLFASRPDPQKDIICPHTYRDWIDPDEVEQIELLIASPSYVSVASVAGHLSLLIRRKNDIRGLSTVVSFVADTTGTVENGFSYMIKGVLGKFRSVIQEETLYDVVQRQTLRENRDIYRLKLNLTREQIDLLIQRIWEIKHTFTYRYYFFNKNCTTMLLNLVNDALGKDRQVKDRYSIDLPLNIASILFRAGVAEFVYPEYWSISRQARYNSRRNERIAAEIIDYFNRYMDEQKGREIAGYFKKAGDAHETQRSLYYQKLLDLYFDCFNDRVAGDAVSYQTLDSGPDARRGEPVLNWGLMKKDSETYPSSFSRHSSTVSPGQRRQYARQGKLLLNYFMNAKEREIYLVLTSIPEQTLNSDKEINVFDTPVIGELMTSALKLRYFLSREIGDEVSALHGEIEDEWNRYTLEERSKRTYSCGYSPVVFSAGYTATKNRSYFVPGLAFSTFFQRLGDNSVFSLGQDTHLELLSLGVSLKTGLGREPTVTNHSGDAMRYDNLFSFPNHTQAGVNSTLSCKRFKLFEFKKILKKNASDYTGKWNKGFGITLYETYSDKEMEIGRDTTICNFRYILNLFETGNFRNYVNIEIGPGYSYITRLWGGKHSFLDVLLDINGQFHPFPYRFHAIRFGVAFRPRLNFKYHPLANFKAGVEADWIFGARSNTVLTTGISYEKNILRDWPGEIENFTSGRLSVYLSFRVNNKWLPGLADLKKLLNRIF